MGITKERFNQGLTYEEYKASMTRNQERFAENERTVKLDAGDVAFFSGLSEPLNTVVLAQDWCGDVIANLPVLGRLATESGKLNLRVFPRDQNLDIMDQYLKQGQFRSIPVFVFFDQDFNELGYFIERPAEVTAANARFRDDLFANDPILSKFSPETSPGELSEEARQRISEANRIHRDEQRPFSDNEVVREIREIVAQGLNATGAAKA